MCTLCQVYTTALELRVEDALGMQMQVDPSSPCSTLDCIYILFYFHLVRWFTCLKREMLLPPTMLMRTRRRKRSSRKVIIITFIIIVRCYRKSSWKRSSRSRKSSWKRSDRRRKRSWKRSNRRMKRSWKKSSRN